MGKITILPTTTRIPITLMGERAGICWGGDISDSNINYKRGIECIESGHGRVFEYVDVELIIDGYSARVIREWYSHIGGAPTRLQASTRYINYQDGFEYITPVTISKSSKAKEIYDRVMNTISEAGKKLEDLGIPREDSAMILPLGMATKIVDKRNLRNLIDMSRQRMCNRAYWEYRELFKDICKALSQYSDEWKYIIDNQMKPKCEVLGYCPESRGCGKLKKARR